MPASPVAAETPWAPPALELDPAGLKYLVIDEIVGSAIGLTLSEWPQLDQAGRLRFRSSAQMLGADRHDLQQFLGSYRRPLTLSQRPLRIGDVFAVTVIEASLARAGDALDDQRRLEPRLPAASWIKPPVYDLTAEAREAAKVSFYAAVAPTLQPHEAQRLAALTSDAT